MKLVFLVYDSRSGSTLLSREIATHFPDVHVTPEIRFDPLLGRPPRWWQTAGPERIQEILESVRVPQKLEVAPAEVRRIASDARDVRGLIEALVAASCSRDRGAAPAQAVIKSGRHLRAWRRILADVPDARFLFIVRDPRAAIASKLATERPYRTGQKMAWAGSFAAAVQWRWYSRLARSVGRRSPLHCVVYETLLERHAEVLAGLSGFFESPVGAGALDYRIPPAEHAIHARALAGGVDAGRASAWRAELAPDDQAVIELVCGGEMRRWGYEPELRVGAIRALRLLAGSLATSAWLVLRESAARLRGGRRRAG
jgi:hypothetical protein